MKKNSVQDFCLKISVLFLIFLLALAGRVSAERKICIEKIDVAGLIVKGPFPASVIDGRLYMEFSKIIQGLGFDYLNSLSQFCSLPSFETASFVFGIPVVSSFASSMVPVAGIAREYGMQAFWIKYSKSLVLVPRITNKDQWTEKLESMILKKSKEYDVDHNLVRAIVRIESSFRPLSVSERGAIGPMQLMPGTARKLGVNPHNTEQNLDGGIRYLKELMNQFNNDLSLTLAAYNAGPGAVRRYGGIPPYKQTGHYVKKVIGIYRKTKKNTR